MHSPSELWGPWHSVTPKDGPVPPAVRTVPDGAKYRPGARGAMQAVI